MPILVRLDEILLRRKVSLTTLSARIGITIANLSILKTNKARAIRFSTLEAICRELDCQPADLLEYVPDSSDSPDHADHPDIPVEPGTTPG